MYILFLVTIIFVNVLYEVSRAIFHSKLVIPNNHPYKYLNMYTSDY